MRIFRILLTSVAALAFANAAVTPARAETLETPTFDRDAPVLFTAKAMSYDAATGLVVFSGGVEAASGGRTLFAEDVSYDSKNNKVVATGRVSIVEADGKVLSGDKIEITGDLKDGLIENAGLLLNERARMAAARASRSGGKQTTLERASFSPCSICAKDGQREPLWQIKAVKIVWDEEARTISYEDARFEFFGVPVLGLPDFSHADPSVTRESGFLAPLAGSASRLGFFLEAPYFLALDPSYDLTITPVIATKVNPVLKLEWRQRTANGQYILSGSYTYDDRLDGDGNPIGGQTSYSHIFGKGRFRLSDEISWGFNLERTSNDTYLRRYDLSDTDRLTSLAYIAWRKGRSRIKLSAYAFQGLRDTDDPGRTPFVLPLIDAMLDLGDPGFGGRLTFSANSAGITRSDGLSTWRSSAGLDWSRPFVFDNGLALKLFASVRADLYYADNPDPVLHPGVRDGAFVSRVTGYAGADLRWPFVRAGEDGSIQLIEPIAQLIVAPRGHGASGIPNEDSVSLEFDDTNLFAANKFPGFDLVETGSRFNLGLRYAEFFENGGSFEVLAGLNLRVAGDAAFPALSGLGETQSDWVARISYTPWPGLSIEQRLRLDKDDFSVRRNEVYLRGKGSFYEVDGSYLRLASDPGNPALGPREEVNLRARAFVSEYWSLIGGIRRDLQGGQMIENLLGVAYEDECSFMQLGLRRRFTSDRDATPGTVVQFTVRLKILGDSGEPVSLFDRDPYLGSENRELNDISGF